MQILAVGAHSDDMDFFCGGTLALYAAAGHNIGICCLADGRTGGKAASPEQLAEMRHAEFLESASVIGAQTFWIGIPDGEVTDDLETRRLVMEIIRPFRPDLIVTHPPNDYHPDHIATSHLVMDASFTARIGVAPVLFVDTESGHDCSPDEYVDVTDVWDQKIAMLNAHHSQYDGWVNPQTGQSENWLVDRATVLGRFRGLQCGVWYSEAFRVFRAHGRIQAGRLLP
jgi:LmbE family N-acetylglucosaminyl deacetylase